MDTHTHTSQRLPLLRGYLSMRAAAKCPSLLFITNTLMGQILIQQLINVKSILRNTDIEQTGVCADRLELAVS